MSWNDPENAPSGPVEKLLYEVKKTIVGQDALLERMLVALLARGHILVEGVPGLAKTLAVKSLAEAMGGDFRRVQFTPTWCPPTSSAPASTTSRPASSRSSSARCSPTCCWPTRSTAPRRRCRAPCWR